MYTLPAESTATSIGFAPVVPRTEEVPPDVILVTVLSARLLVYTLPDESTAIPRGVFPVTPSVEALPDAVTFVTVFARELAV